MIGRVRHFAHTITSITVSGFKSLQNDVEIKIHPLTIIAGANSSGKSSIMQPLLLMKQTLEAPYDPGHLLLDGPNVRFTDSGQFLSHQSSHQYPILKVKIALSRSYIINTFQKDPNKRQIELSEMIVSDDMKTLTYRQGMSYDEFAAQLPPVELERELTRVQRLFSGRPEQFRRFEIVSKRCFLRLQGNKLLHHTLTRPSERFEEAILGVIHVPGLRRSPERTYNTSAGYETFFPGTFENYVASIINYWQDSQDGHLEELIAWLGKDLKLTSAIGAKAINDVQIELRVGRAQNSQSDDMVSIADVGLGVSQVIPALVALLVAEPGQLVYIEQPELHLHPKAQVALAQVLVDAANRGVRVVAETHSSLLLLGIQTLIAEGKLNPENTILHWFTRNDEGATIIRSEVPDENGAYGDWPEDFSDVELNTQSRYLDAVALREMGT